MENSPTLYPVPRSKGGVYRIKEMPPGFREALIARKALIGRHGGQPAFSGAMSFTEIQMRVRRQLKAEARGRRALEARVPGEPKSREQEPRLRPRPQPGVVGQIYGGETGASHEAAVAALPVPGKAAAPQAHRAAPEKPAAEAAPSAQAVPRRAPKRRSDGVLKLMMAVFSSIFVFAAYMFFSEYVPQYLAKSVENDMKTEYKLPPVPVGGITPDVNDPYYFASPDFDALKAVNKDVNSWIYVPGAQVDAVVVRGTDNDYYLRHTFDKSSNRAGSIFMDYRNNSFFSDQNTVVYGHAMKNGSRFGQLLNFRQQSTYESHPFIIIKMEGVTYYYQIFSVNSLSADYDYRDSNYGASFERWIKDLRAGSLIESSAAVTASSRVITLSTCINDLADGRLAVFGVLLNPEGQELDLSTIKP